MRWFKAFIALLSKHKKIIFVTLLTLISFITIGSIITVNVVQTKKTQIGQKLT
ncbi:hypothetical protein CM1_02735 [Mycoplasmoides genitalium M6320]|uniref:ABC transporter permease n=1 Tax=Mycoplasmoides genitalium M6320 TaxID=662945 RepID=A0ABC7ZIU6_MYCGT|nr:hypothetical protein CM9_02695 [Mycoplasmoides genitalium M2321]AFQ03779.1 hypothetical protein CM3_02820 [Mycoplasmoides genitalium M6282]AFQ04288.1 hypothetical protein CM1_02735 [Mycoplasmoides genitalium M6320]AFQ04794.1 hypothetical protein CM5_02640 [Mycoplasmoides genitalium M2288]